MKQDQDANRVIWHDLECGAYTADLPTWRALAARYGDSVLDVGAGTGRTALELARLGYRVTALDRDPVLLAELARRTNTHTVTTVVSDARDFELSKRFSLIIVPMQTIQLLGGGVARRRFLACAARHLARGGMTAVAITEALEPFGADDGTRLPPPDMREIDGIVYSSQPTAVREVDDGFVLERLRERIGIYGQRSEEQDIIRLDRLSATELERDARSVGLRSLERHVISPTTDHVGSVVVMLGA